jgi:hypothetical protein
VPGHPVACLYPVRTPADLLNTTTS